MIFPRPVCFSLDDIIKMILFNKALQEKHENAFAMFITHILGVSKFLGCKIRKYCELSNMFPIKQI